MGEKNRGAEQNLVNALVHVQLEYRNYGHLHLLSDLFTDSSVLKSNKDYYTRDD